MPSATNLEKGLRAHNLLKVSNPYINEIYNIYNFAAKKITFTYKTHFTSLHKMLQTCFLFGSSCVHISSLRSAPSLFSVPQSKGYLKLRHNSFLPRIFKLIFTTTQQFK